MGIFYVYMLKCLDSKGNTSLYTGSTNNLMRRVDEHQKGQGAKYTRGMELELVYFETLLSRSQAMKREYEIKTFSADKKWKLVRQFSKKKEKKEGSH